MNRRGRNIGLYKNIGMIVFATIIGIAIVAFITSYILYSRKLNSQAKNINNAQKISSAEENTMISMVENTEAVSSTIGKGVNELENKDTEKQNIKNTDKVAINTSKVEEKKSENNNINKNTTEKENIEKEEKNESKIEKDPSFIKPVEGEKIKDYSRENLIYSATLDEWTTHLGIDFASKKTDIVKASADGKIKSIKNDPRYGLTVVIEHSNGFESIYSSLLTAEFIKVGEDVKQGQTIATVGNTARFEVSDETHIHFEIKKDGENVDPNIYIK